MMVDSNGRISGWAAIAAMLGNQTQVMFDNMPSCISHVRAGTLRALAVKKTAAYAAFGTAGLLTVFVKAILCNWMVSLGSVVGLASTSTIGKVIGCWLPIMIFVTQGYEHSVVNMFAIPAGMMLGFLLARAGIDVIVTDHHLPGETLPAATVMVNPNLHGATFGSRALAGVGVAFYVMLATARRLGQPIKPVVECLDLVALGTVPLGISTAESAVRANLSDIKLRLIQPYQTPHNSILVRRDAPYERFAHHGVADPLRRDDQAARAGHVWVQWWL